MRDSFPDMEALMRQLGLSDDYDSLDAFLDAVAPVSAELPIDRLPFWNPAQAEFLKQALADDSDWAEVVDSLSASLRNHCP